MTEVGALLIREGSTEDRLNPLLTALFAEFGATLQVDPFRFQRGRKSLDSALFDAGEQFGDKDLFLIHRDADNAGVQARVDEIQQARELSGLNVETIPVIPVKETEAWILYALHDPEFCNAVEVPHDLVKSHLPKRSNASGVNAKNRLEEIHTLVYENRGGRSKKRRTPKFSTSRSDWLASLDDPQLLNGCSSFENLREEVKRYLDAAATASAERG